MGVLRNCLELCCSPNTVSKFIRIFPRAALLFLILHVVIMIITVIGYSNKGKVAQVEIEKRPFPQAPLDDLGAIPVHKPENYKIPRAFDNKNSSDINGRKKKKRYIFDSRNEKLKL